MSFLGANFLKINDYTALLVGGTGTDMALSTEAQSFTIENGFKLEYQYSSLPAPEHFGSVAFLTEKRNFKMIPSGHPRTMFSKLN